MAGETLFFKLTAAALFFGAAPAVAAPRSAVLSEAAGTVQAHRPGGPWSPVQKGASLDPGIEVRTSRGSRATITFEDESRVELGPASIFALEDAGRQQASMSFTLGTMRAWVNKALTRHFTVKTPTAVCSVRGTEFTVSVREGGNTSVELLKGLLAVADHKGNEIELHEGQRVPITQNGLGKIIGSNELKQNLSDQTRLAMKREVGLDMTKEEVQAAAAVETKSAIYKEGKAMVDVNGHRVRLEQYIIRPAPTQFKLVTLNERSDRFDYFFYLGIFNKPLPTDLSVALRQVQGQAGTPPEYFLTGYQTGRSNTVDKVTEVASGGHLVDVNNNGNAADAVYAAFDPAADATIPLRVPNPGGAGNDKFFKTLFDSYSLAFNNVVHHSWATTNGSYAPTLDANGFPLYSAANRTGAQNTSTHLAYTDATNLISPPNCSTTDNCTQFPDPSKYHQTVYLESPNGAVWEKFDSYIISDQGKVASVSDFAGLTKGSDFKKALLNWNYQQIITASEFGGRKIDLVFEPKVLIQSGLIP